MAGVPQFMTDLGWWAVFLFLFVVVLLRAQATYGLGRWVRRGASTLAAAPDDHPRLARASARFSGPGMEKAKVFLEKWGFVGIPVSFLTIGFQTLVNAAAGYTRMRWDLYTLAMIPGCVAWAALYGVLSLSLIEAWKQSPWLFVAVVAAVVAVAWAAMRLRRTADSAERTPQ